MFFYVRVTSCLHIMALAYFKQKSNKFSITKIICLYQPNQCCRSERNVAVSGRKLITLLPLGHKKLSHYRNLLWKTGGRGRSRMSTDVNNTLETLDHLTRALGKKWLNLNPILHTVWLDNHALSFKSNNAKYYFGEKSSFLHTFLKLSSESRKI